MNTIEKPLGHRAYGSIPHLPGSRRGPGDHGISEAQARICLTRVRDKHDRVIVQNKLDGSNVAVARLNGEIVPLIRAGYRARDSHYEQHHWWHYYVMSNRKPFRSLLHDGEWLSGEWLAQAHGTRYDLTNRSPFVAFDLWWQDGEAKRRLCYDELVGRLEGRFMYAQGIAFGPTSIDVAMAHVDRRLYGELDQPEGAIWRIERKGVIDFVCKYVRPGKIDGVYLPDISGAESVWNWRPENVQ